MKYFTLDIFLVVTPTFLECPLRFKEQLHRSTVEISRLHHAHCTQALPSLPLNIHCLTPLNPRVKLIILGVAICFQKVILNGVKSAPHCLTWNLILRDHQRGSVYGEEVNLVALWRCDNFWLVFRKEQSGPYLNLILGINDIGQRLARSKSTIDGEAIKYKKS